MPEELKPCPYCNSTAIEFLKDVEGAVVYCCRSCGLCGPLGENAIEAEQKWNSLLRKSELERLERNVVVEGLQQIWADRKELENRYKDAMQSLFDIGAIVQRATCQKN